MTFVFDAEFRPNEGEWVLTLTELVGLNDPRMEDKEMQGRAVRAVEGILDAIDPGHEKQAP